MHFIWLHSNDDTIATIDISLTDWSNNIADWFTDIASICELTVANKTHRLLYLTTCWAAVDAPDAAR